MTVLEFVLTLFLTLYFWLHMPFLTNRTVLVCTLSEFKIRRLGTTVFILGITEKHNRFGTIRAVTLCPGLSDWDVLLRDPSKENYIFLIYKKIQTERLQSHIRGRASEYMRKCANI